MTHQKASIVVQSPGRINLIGEHTDYNEGYILPAAIDKKTTMRLRRNGSSSTVQVMANDVKESFSFDLLHISPIQGGWQNYILGVVHELQQLGAQLEGFEATFESNVPIGAGLSSSAALECSLAFALNELFNLGFDKWQLIKASQMAEHHFVGVKCGIMDQFASLMGKKDHAMLLDCRSLEFQYQPLQLETHQLLLLNTNVSHTHATSAYNDRRAACEEGVAILRKTGLELTSLRDLSLDELTKHETSLPTPIYRRCYHVVSENDRVLAAVQALQQNDLTTLGSLLYESHFSLRNDYEVSCPELDFLVNQTLNKDYIPGSRMMGGGFGGCTLQIIEKEWSDAFVEQVSEKYFKAFGIDLNPYSVSIVDGTKEVY